ncbi:MAG: hypothetical protein ACLR54_00285 [Oscillospiraceae bacterium]
MGAELVPFSPLADERLPDGVQGLYLGGGYPELYAAQLEANHTLRRQIRGAVHAGMPCIAECGGFMYLTQSIAGHAMAGALPGDCFDTGKLTRFGYITATAQEDSLLCRAGEQVPMHEFHHWDTPSPAALFWRKSPPASSGAVRMPRTRCTRVSPTSIFTPSPSWHNAFWRLAERRRYDGADEAYGYRETQLCHHHRAAGRPAAGPGKRAGHQASHPHHGGL